MPKITNETLLACNSIEELFQILKSEEVKVGKESFTIVGYNSEDSTILVSDPSGIQAAGGDYIEDGLESPAYAMLDPQTVVEGIDLDVINTKATATDVENFESETTTADTDADSFDDPFASDDINSESTTETNEESTTEDVDFTEETVTPTIKKTPTASKKRMSRKDKELEKIARLKGESQPANKSKTTVVEEAGRMIGELTPDKTNNSAPDTEEDEEKNIAAVEPIKDTDKPIMTKEQGEELKKELEKVQDAAVEEANKQSNGVIKVSDNLPCGVLDAFTKLGEVLGIPVNPTKSLPSLKFVGDDSDKANFAQMIEHIANADTAESEKEGLAGLLAVLSLIAFK